MGFLYFALVFEFDILMGYALVAMVVAPLLLSRTRWLVLAAGLVGAFHLFMQFRDLRGGATGVTDVKWEIPVDGFVSPGTYLGEVADRVTNIWEMGTAAFMIAPPLSAFLFLTGALLWRAGLFRADGRARRMSVWLTVGGLGLGVPRSRRAGWPWSPSPRPRSAPPSSDGAGVPWRRSWLPAWGTWSCGASCCRS